MTFHDSLNTHYDRVSWQSLSHEIDLLHCCGVYMNQVHWYDSTKNTCDTYIFVDMTKFSRKFHD